MAYSTINGELFRIPVPTSAELKDLPRELPANAEGPGFTVYQAAALARKSNPFLQGVIEFDQRLYLPVIRHRHQYNDELIDAEAAGIGKGYDFTAGALMMVEARRRGFADFEGYVKWLVGSSSPLNITCQGMFRMQEIYSGKVHLDTFGDLKTKLTIADRDWDSYQTAARYFTAVLGNEKLRHEVAMRREQWDLNMRPSEVLGDGFMRGVKCAVSVFVQQYEVNTLQAISVA